MPSQGAETDYGKPLDTDGVVIEPYCYNCKREHPANCTTPGREFSGCTVILDPSGAVKGKNHICPYCGFNWNDWKITSTPIH